MTIADTRPAVEFGAFYNGSVRSPRSQVFEPDEFARRAEEIGFDSVWSGDHISRNQDGISTLSIFAASTKRIAIGTSVMVLPLRPAAVTAKGILGAALVARDRRTIMGAGPGGDVPHEFALVGADMTTRGAYTDEALDVIKLLWTGESVSFEGRWNKFSDVVMHPIPERLPEIFIGGRSEAALRRSLRVGDGFLPYLVDPRQANIRFKKIVALNDAQYRRSLKDFTFGAVTFMVVGDSISDAAEKTAQFEGFRGVDEAMLRRFYALGTASECLIKLREYVESGTNHLLVACNFGNERQLDSYSEVMTEILPKLRAEIAEGLGAEARASLVSDGFLNLSREHQLSQQCRHGGR